MNNRLKVNLISIIYFFLLLPFFKPALISNVMPFMNKMFLALQIISVIIIFIMYLLKRKWSKIIIFILIFECILLFSTLINSGDLTSQIKSFIQIIALCMICDFGLRYNTDNFLEALLFLFELLVYINLLTIIKYPNGMYVSKYTLYTENWLLGYDNLHILTILPANTISYIYSYRKYNRMTLRSLLLLLFSVISLVLRWSATGLIGMGLFILFVIFSKKIIHEKKCNFKNYLILNIVMFFSIIVFKIQNIFSFIIVDVLKKDLTFTGRTYIWNYVLEFIKKKLLFGYGVENSMVRYNKTLLYKTFHAHNQILEIMYQGGVFLIVVFSILLFMIMKKLNRYKNNRVSKILGWVLFIYFIMMLTEAYSYEYIFYIFVIAYNVEYLIKASQEVKPCEQKVVPKI